MYVITLDPAETPVTNPALLMVATPMFDETQGVFVAAVAEPANCVLEFTHTDNVPVIVGNGLTVTVTFTVNGWVQFGAVLYSILVNVKVVLEFNEPVLKVIVPVDPKLTVFVVALIV